MNITLLVITALVAWLVLGVIATKLLILAQMEKDRAYVRYMSGALILFWPFTLLCLAAELLAKVGRRL